MRLVPLAALLAAAAATGQPKPAEVPVPDGMTKVCTVEGLTEYKLANGLKVLLLPDDSQPKVTVNCTIFVGSRHEGYGETGMAHLLEHMVFKGCPKFPDVPKALRDHGADFNGTTWLDRTNYFETMPATDDNLEFGIELEADRLANSFIAREELLKEFTVVRNEFERGENSAERVLSQRMTATAFEWHNYGKSTIGNRTDIERVPIENLQAFYKKYYRPDNAMLIVAGKFDPAKALALAAKHFGALKNPATEIPATYTEEPPQDGERSVTLRRVGTVGATGVVYHIPAATHPDYPAVEVLEAVLTDAPSGRVYKALVEAKLASSISGSTYALHDPGILEVTAATEPDKTEAARDALLATLEDLAKAPVTAAEVERMKLQFAKMNEKLLANSQRFAISLSESAACGDWRLFFVHRDRLEKVTADDVNRVAAKYLVRTNRTVGIYVPTKQAERAEIPAGPKATDLVANYKGREAVAAGEAFDPTPENVEKRVKRGTIEGVQFALLPKKTRGETVNLTMNLRVGTAEAFMGRKDAYDFLGSMLMRGTKTKSRQQLKDEFDKLGASVSISTDADRGLGLVAIGVSTKRANLDATLALLKEVLREPAFPENEFEVLKREAVDGLEKAKTEPQALAVQALRRKLNDYPKTDIRYVPTIEEAEASLKACTLDQVKALYADVMGAGAGEFAIVGDFESEPALRVVEGLLKGWTPKVPYVRIDRPAKPVAAGSLEKILTPDKANALYVAGLTFELTDSDPDYAPLVIGNYVLGAAPLASKLSNRVRGKDGLSYGVGSQANASPIDKAGMFMIFAITNPGNIDKVDAAIAEEVAKFLKDGLSATELEEAKKAYLQSQKQGRANDGTLAGQLAGALFAKRTFQYYADLEKKIEAIQPDDVKKAFDKLVDQKKLTIVEAGDFGKKKPDENKPGTDDTKPTTEGKK